MGGGGRKEIEWGERERGGAIGLRDGGAVKKMRSEK
jgi:hypothetical protein